jgi:hypothetical protein
MRNSLPMPKMKEPKPYKPPHPVVEWLRYDLPYWAGHVVSATLGSSMTIAVMKLTGVL